MSQSKVNGPRDPSAFVQQLSDTSTVQRLCDSSLQLSSRTYNREQGYGPEFYDKLEGYHTMLDDAMTNPRLPSTRSLLAEHGELQKLVGILSDCLKWLSDTFPSVPEGRAATLWLYANRVISEGCAYPSHADSDPADTSYNNWLGLLDCFNHGPSFRLLCRVLQVAAELSVFQSTNEPRCGCFTKAGLHPNYQPQGGCCAESSPGSCCRHHRGQMIYRALAERLLVDLNYYLMLMTIWFKKAFFHPWDNEPVLRKGTIGYAALMMLECMHTRVAESVEVSSMGFSMPVVSDRVDASYMVQSYIDLPEPKSGHLFDFGFLFDFSRKCFYFRTLNHLRMRKADSDAQKAYAIRSRAFGATGLGKPQLRGQLRSLEEHYLLLNVSRGNVLQDAFDQLWQRQRSELLRPLRVRLGEIDEFEVGHDLGGVQIEFFNLVCKELFAESAR